MNKQYLWGDATLLSASAAALLRAPRFFSTTTTGSEILFYHYHGFRCLRSYTTWLLVRRPAITGLLNLVRYAHSITSICPINYHLLGRYTRQQ